MSDKERNLDVADTGTGSLLKKLNALSDHVISDSNESGTQKPEAAPAPDSSTRPVVPKKEVKQPEQDPELDGIIINCAGDAPEIGDEVTSSTDDSIEDGEYTFLDENEEEILVYVKDGEIAAIGAEQVSDLMKKVVRGGKVITKKISLKKKRLTPAQKQALKKAQKKAHTAAAQKQRAKSMKVRKQKIAASTEEGNEYDGLDLNALGDALLTAVLTHLKDQLQLGDEQIDFLDEVLTEDILIPRIEDGKIVVEIPVWTEIDDEVELADCGTQTLEIELDGEFDNDSLLAQLTEGDDSILGNVII